jgi:bacterioferritin
VAAENQEVAVDQRELISLLNEDLKTEYQSIVQYTQHIATIKGAKYQSLIEELRKHVAQELTHALTLADQVDFLGGVPTVEVPTIRNEPDEDAALRLDLELETAQLQRYRERVEQATAIGLPDVAEALRPLLVQTQDHVMDLRTGLGE